MNLHRHTLLVIFFASVLLLLAARPARGQQRFTVIRDTVRINAADYFSPISTVSLGWFVKYQGWYFCLFEEKDVFEFWKGNRILLAISEDGHEVRKVDFPSKEFSGYGDFFVRDGKLILKPYYTEFSGRGYIFDDKNESWKPIYSISDIIYEDDLHTVAFKDYGEWGDYTWFIKKKNKTQYIRPERFSRIVRIDSVYYFVHQNRIDSVLVSDTMGYRSDGLWHYNNTTMWLFERDMFRNNPEMLSTLSTVKPQPSIFTSKGKEGSDMLSLYFDLITYDTIINHAFSVGKQLFPIVTTPQKTIVAKVRKGQLQEVVDFGCKYNFIQKHDCYRGVNVANNQSLLGFKENYHTSGILDVEDSVIRILNITHNQDTLHTLGTDNVGKLLEHLLNNFNNLSINNLYSIEQELGGTGNHQFETFDNGYFPDEYKNNNEFVGTKYYKVVDNTQTLITPYCIHLPDSMVKGVYLTWVKTNFFDSDSRWSADAEGYEAKCAELSDIITHLTGKKPKQVDNHQEWDCKGFTIRYFCTCKIYRYESPSTYAFAHILRLCTATAGGAACAGATAIQNRSGHVVPDGGREDELEFRRLLRSIQTDVPVLRG